MNYLVDKKCYIPNTEVTIRSIVKKEEEPKPIPVFSKNVSNYKVHPSIMKLSRTYPAMKLPRICLSSNVAPVVEMEIDEVENYFKRLKLDFKLCVKKALACTKPSSKLMHLSKEHKSLKQTKVKILPEEIKINQTSNHRKIKTDKHETKNKKEPRQTPSKSPGKGYYAKSPVRSNEKRNLIENSSIEETLPKLVGSETVINCTVPNNRKRKLFATEKCLQQNDKNVREKESAKHTNSDLINAKRKIKSNENISKEEGNSEKMLLMGFNNSFSSPRKKKLSSENSLGRSIAAEARSSNNITPEKYRFNGRKVTEKQHVSKEKTDEESAAKNVIASKTCTYKDAEISGTGKDQNDECESLTSVGRSVPLFVCEICSSVHYNMYELKKHQNKHMRCQFCKIRLRSLENKDYHVENVCKIRKMMNDLPQVRLVKIEHNGIARQRFPAAFIGFSTLPRVENVGVRNRDAISVKTTFFKGFPKRLDIDISEKEQSSIVPDISSNAFVEAFKNEVLRNLLTTFQHSSVGIETQTDTVTNYDIEIIESNKAVIKDLLGYLKMYRIPIKLQPGEFNVTCEYNDKSNSPKNLCFWNDLTPINVKSKTEGCNK